MSDLNKQIIEDWNKKYFWVDDWEFWKDEYRFNDKILIAGPSRIVGLVDLTRFDDGDFEWVTYGKRSEPTKKMKGRFVFGGSTYPTHFLMEIYPFLSESVEVSQYKQGIFFKVSEDIAIGISERTLHKDFYYDDEGVMFIEEDFEEEKPEHRTTATAKEFVKWIDNVAIRIHSGQSHGWEEEVYRFEKFFEEEEEMGDMMLL